MTDTAPARPVFAFRYPGDDASELVPRGTDIEGWLEQQVKAGEAGGAP